MRKVLLIMLAVGWAATASATPAQTQASPELTAFKALSRTGDAAQMTRVRWQDEDPEEMGACIHSVSWGRTCNEITRRWCISGGFAKASFYPGETCESLKRQGLYSGLDGSANPTG